MGQVSVEMLLDGMSGYDHLTALVTENRHRVYVFEVEVTRHFVEKGRRMMQTFDVERFGTLNEVRAYLCTMKVSRIRDHNGNLRDMDWNLIKR